MTAGRLVLMGSGEIAPSMVSTHREALDAAGADRVTILDTPYGFQENADQLSERIAGYFRTSLSVTAEVATLRGPADDVLTRERMLAAVSRARYVFAGPGSPSYAIRTWREVDLAPRLRGVIAAGGTVTLASAAALTAGTHTIPVYEIYKVGEDPRWLEGLDLTSAFRLPMVVVPHWNNAEGGNHDTSRCYIGARRLAVLERDLDVGIIGVDEHTSATVDFGSGELGVAGVGTVTLRGGDGDRAVESGQVLGLDEVRAHLGSPPTAGVDGGAEGRGPVGFRRALESHDADGAVAAALEAEDAAGSDPRLRRLLRSMIVDLGDAARRGLRDPRAIVGEYVELLLDLRRVAREERRFDEADRIRDGLTALGVEVRDTPDGVEWHLRG